MLGEEQVIFLIFFQAAMRELKATCQKEGKTRQELVERAVEIAKKHRIYHEGNFLGERGSDNAVVQAMLHFFLKEGEAYEDLLRLNLAYLSCKDQLGVPPEVAV